MKNYSTDEYTAAGCMQFEMPRMGILIYLAMGGNICPSCPKDNRCAAQDILSGKDRAVAREDFMARPQTETVREEAARRGISIKRVRAERRDLANGGGR